MLLLHTCCAPCSAAIIEKLLSLEERFALFFFNIRIGAQGEQKYLLIYVDNQLVMEFSIDDQTEREVDFPFGKNAEYTATLQISGGMARLLPLPESLCPRGICSHTGWISQSYQSIVCVPNRIMIYFSEGRKQSPEYYGITY